MVPVKSGHRWTDWEADSLFDEEEKTEDLSGDMFDVSASPASSPIADERSCDNQAEVEDESRKDESEKDESRKDDSRKDESGNRPYLEKTQCAVTEQQKKTPVNGRKPTIVIDLIDSPSPIQKAKPRSVWLSSRKKKQTRLDFYWRPSAAVHKTFKAPLAKVVPIAPVVPSPSTTDQQRPVALMPTQVGPSSTVQQEPIEIDSSSDESPLVELSSSQGTSSETEPEAPHRELEVTIAPFTSQHGTVGSVLLEQTIAPSPVKDVVAAAHKTFKAPLAKVVPVVPSALTTDQQRSVALLPTQVPSSNVQQELIETDSSADESPLVELSSSQGSSSEADPDAVQRELEATIAPFATQHATVGSVLLEQTIAPSPANDIIAPELSSLIEESAPNTSRIKINHLKRRASSPEVNTASKPVPSSSFINNYDDFELPRRDEPNAGEVVRNKKERDRLHGFDCMCCKSYYDGLNLSPKSRAERINQISRHRAVQMMPLTPENYWEVDMPDTQECIKRGYIKDSPYVRRQPKNWRPRRQRTKNDDETDVR